MRITIPIFLALIIAAPTWSDEQSSARELAREAYFEFEANVFNSVAKAAALEQLKRAYAIGPEEPWVLMAASLGNLVNGYRSGDWYEADRFIPSQLELALEFGQRAYEIAPSDPDVMAYAGRLAILTKDFDRAAELTRKAARADIDNFYPWYFNGILLKKLGHAESALAHFEEAEKRAFLPHHYRLVSTHRKHVARMQSNSDREEQLLKEAIVGAPEKARPYGNYANFLERTGRLEEAVQMWEEAIARETYPLARKGLARTRAALEALELGESPAAPQD